MCTTDVASMSERCLSFLKTRRCLYALHALKFWGRGRGIFSAAIVRLLPFLRLLVFAVFFEGCALCVVYFFLGCFCFVSVGQRKLLKKIWLCETGNRKGAGALRIVLCAVELDLKNKDMRIFHFR